MTAQGITVDGLKAFLYFIQIGTEKEKMLTVFLEESGGRGLDCFKKVLVVMDGRKGLRNTVKHAFGELALVHSINETKSQG